MKIVVDINHPAHVHYFKNFIWEMEKRGHDILITSSEKDISYRLLDLYGLDYHKIGNYGDSIIKKFFNILVLDWRMFQTVKSYNPDIFLGFGSIRAAHVAKLMGKPYIALDDSEPSPFEHLLYVPFADAILTPTTFKKNFGVKHHKFESFIELAYLHPNYFTPDPSVLREINEEMNAPFVLLRFVAWQAMHDVGKKGFSLDTKIKLVNKLKQYATVYISSEKPLPPELELYRIRISPEKIHHVLHYARLFVGDSQTMTTEAAMLGTPAIRCNSFVGENDMGNFIELEKSFGLIFNYDDPEKAREKAVGLLQQNMLKELWQKKREHLLNSKIDITQYIIEFVENFDPVIRCNSTSSND